jgi:hypothetical protein
LVRERVGNDLIREGKSVRVGIGFGKLKASAEEADGGKKITVRKAVSAIQ